MGGGVPGASVSVPAGWLGALTVASAGVAAVVLWRWCRTVAVSAACRDRHDTLRGSIGA